MEEKGENVYIDTLTYEEFMMIDKASLGRRFTKLDEKEQRARLNREQANELEFVDDTQKGDGTASGGVSTGVRKSVKREKAEWEDNLTNRILHWEYSEAQKAELKTAVSEGIPKRIILEYFYPDVSVERMKAIRETNQVIY